MERNSFMFYRSFFEALRCLPDEDRLQAYDALVEYALNGVEIEVSGAAKAMLYMAKPQIDANNKKYQNGQKGGRKPKMDDIPYAEIIGYLNEKTGKKFSEKSKETMSHIKARWDEGHGIDDFKKVIDVKCAEWLGDSKMENYLRPITLFRPGNFENYLNQKPVERKQIRTKFVNFEQRSDAEWSEIEAQLDRQFAGI